MDHESKVEDHLDLLGSALAASNNGTDCAEYQHLTSRAVLYIAQFAGRVNSFPQIAEDVVEGLTESFADVDEVLNAAYYFDKGFDPDADDSLDHTDEAWVIILNAAKQAFGAAFDAQIAKAKKGGY